jgi:hypothetical protein
MAEWELANTNTHQDHVIAHVIGATVLAHFIWDETAYLLLDIGFIWNIYLDVEMGLVPQTQAISELDADAQVKTEIASDVDQISLSDEHSLVRFARCAVRSPITSVDFLVSEDARQLRLNCEEGRIVIETSLETAEIKIFEDIEK